MAAGKKYILALDQGTTSSRAILFDHNSKIIAVAQTEFEQIFPQPGWVEHDPLVIWNTQKKVMQEVLIKAKVDSSEIAALGIANQRETTVVWNRKTGLPIYNAIVWQCRRTAGYCDKLKEVAGFVEYVKENTGLVIDAYFSATKLKWILDNVDKARFLAEKGDLLFGTVDSWLLWKLTNGKVHATDYSNASRTMLFNIKTLQWDQKILDELTIPLSLLPQIRDSSMIYGYTENKLFGNSSIPIAGIAGDQQAALFGQCCFKPGMAKNTYGTGCFLMMNTGLERFRSHKGLLTTIAWGLNGKINYALEGSVFMAGASISWLRDELQLITTAEESEECATRIVDSGGVYVVPAFVGLGAPYWDMYARGTIFGLTRGTNKDHIVRATLEAIAFQARDLFEAIGEDCREVSLKELKVDGGACLNNFLMQFQADMLNVPVVRSKIVETTALGAAYLAGLAVGFWCDLADVSANWHKERQFNPKMIDKERSELYKGWQKAVARSRNWLDS